MRVAVAVGLLAGVLSGLSRVYLAGPIDVWVNSIGVWLVPPFVVGVFAGRVVLGVTAGVVASVLQMAAFFAVTRALDGMVLWFAAAVAAGVVCGGLGALVSARWRAGRRASRAAPRSRGRGR